MSRATPLQYEDATPEQKEVWDALVASRGNPTGLVGPDGGLVGPFNSMVSSPIIGKRISALGAKIRFENSVDNRLLELAICTVGAHWRSNFEFWAHGRMAVDAGIDQAVIDALAAGETPTFAHDDEACVYDFAKQLVTSGRVDADRFAATHAIVGEPGIFDLISGIGYYCLISLTLNALEVPLPPGETPIWTS
ncbi:MAG: carboxymuconolactone decarboxylase family protein [Actinomycetota bacterium]